MKLLPLQKRVIRGDEALRRIGLSPQQIRLGPPRSPDANPWRRAGKAAIIAELRRREAAGERLTWKTTLHTPNGWAFLIRAKGLFGSWSRALAAAGLEPSSGIRSPWLKADKATVLAELRRRRRSGESLKYGSIRKEKWGKPLLQRAQSFFGSWADVLLALDIDPKYGRSPWPMADRATVLAELRRRHHAGEPLGYDAIAKETWGQALRKRCRVLFGTWAAALHAAGIEPGKENSPWRHANEAAILAEVHRRNLTGESLHYKEIHTTKWGGPFLRRAETLFGSWSLAVLAAGVDLPSGTWSPWPTADKTDVLAELRRRQRAGKSLRSREIAKEQWGDPFLKRSKALFGSWQAALRAAGVPVAGRRTL